MLNTQSDATSDCAYPVITIHAAGLEQINKTLLITWTNGPIGMLRGGEKKLREKDKGCIIVRTVGYGYLVTDQALLYDTVLLSDAITEQTGRTIAGIEHSYLTKQEKARIIKDKAEGYVTEARLYEGLYQDAQRVYQDSRSRLEAAVGALPPEQWDSAEVCKAIGYMYQAMWAVAVYDMLHHSSMGLPLWEDLRRVVMILAAAGVPIPGRVAIKMLVASWHPVLGSRTSVQRGHGT
jgi:hypothetical protein